MTTLTETELAQIRAIVREELKGAVTTVQMGARATRVDRPKPAVELPTVPTLGWVRGETFDPLLAVWVRDDTTNDAPTFRAPAHVLHPDYVTAFTAATAVPTAVLEILRSLAWLCPGPIGTFLAAVDAANGVSR